MSKKLYSKLLKNRKVIEEINRHRWIESEKAGYDIGFEFASMDWLEKFSAAWMQYHMPKQKMAPFGEKVPPLKFTPQKSLDVKA